MGKSCLSCESMFDFPTPQIAVTRLSSSCLRPFGVPWQSVHMVDGAAGLSNEVIIAGLQALVGEGQVLFEPIDLQAHAGDASIYRLVPRVVVRPRTVDDVKAILAYCRENGLYLTFRAAGTSLSGQAVTDGVLVDVASHWKRIQVLNGGKQVAAQPGAVGAHVNAFLARHHAKIGPDPASINACMMGGMAANNASGMCCGVAQNSYHTMASMKFVLADGFELDTALPDADDVLRRERPELCKGLLHIREQILQKPELEEMIRHKYSIKNTCGYGMNSFVDFERPLDILSHLLIGSEGTLGFISEITLNTVPDKPLKATALVYFAELMDAGASIAPLGQAGAALLEIMDRSSMLLIGRDLREDFHIIGNCAALLIEFQEDDEAVLQDRMDEATRILGRWPLLQSVEFTRDPKRQEGFWSFRKGLFPSVGAMREMGTACMIEDICVRPEQLAPCIEDLQSLFSRHRFDEAIIFGHAKDGNLHFVISTNFASQRQARHYAALMDELTGIISARYGGSLKAEHGTGRNIAPFVAREWGHEIHELMWEVKRLLDPMNVLNPGVILNHDPDVHMKHLKVMPAVSPIVDKCIECGFCEARCPSRALTTTPRQRIVLLREMMRLRTLGDPASARLSKELEAAYQYHGIATCAADGMCATACPVKIDTGSMIKNLRAGAHSPKAQRRAVMAAQHYGLLLQGAWLALAALRLGGPLAVALARKPAEWMHKSTHGLTPRLPKQIPLPRPAPALPRGDGTADGCDPERTVIFFPACLTRVMGHIPRERGKVGLAQAVVDVLHACGYKVIIPEDIADACCGQAFYSKGFFEAAQEASALTMRMLWRESRQGRYPIVCDTSPCSGQLLSAESLLTGDDLKKWRDLTIFDFSSFMARRVIPTRQEWPRVNREIILHPTCTLIKLGGLDDLKLVAETFATKATVPIMAECCGFAGDKGFGYPELTLSATKPEADEVKIVARQAAACGASVEFYSTCRTCEIGMSATTHEAYRSIAYLCRDALIKE